MTTVKPDSRKIRSFTRLYWEQGRRVLAQTTAPVINLLGNVPLEEVKNRAEHMMDSQELRQYLIELWSKTGTYFAQDMSTTLIQRQSKEGNAWEEGYIQYILARVTKKAKDIARTQATLFNSVIDLVVQEGYRDGLSIDAITERLQYEVKKRMLSVQKYEAERIARTEVIGAANKGSFDGAMSTGLGIKKGWLTSGLKGVRASHGSYEGMGFVPMNYEYNFGLMHPGDPNGTAEEIINCRCTIIYATQI